MDNVAATVGLKLWRPGDAYLAAGTVTNAGVLLDAPVFDGKGLVYHYGIGDRWLVNGGVDYGGAGLRWFRDILEDVDFAELDRLGEATGCGEHPLVFVPYMAGQRAPLWNDDASGVVLGITPQTERRHLVRMFMESVALGARHVIEELCPARPARAALTGGITRNPRWSQLVADVTGIRLSLCAHPEVSALGAAILAGLGVGLFASPEDAFARVPEGASCEPSPAHRAYYDALYGVFRSAYCNVADALAGLSALRARGPADGVRSPPCNDLEGVQP
jgi:sugar (pentulose or hexulose) kinase